jgi:hypothetical protein
MRSSYRELIYDKRRNIADWVVICQAPIIFTVIAYFFKLPLDITWAIKWSMAFVIGCILIKGRSFLHEIHIVDRHFREDKLIISDPHHERPSNYIQWSNYRNYQRKRSSQSIILVILFTVISRILFPEYYWDIFLILFYIDGGLFLFITLNDIKKYISGLINFFSEKLDSSISTHNNLNKLNEPLKYRRFIMEAMIITLIYMIVIDKILEMGIFQYIQYSLAFFIIYLIGRLFIQLRQYFVSALKYIDNVSNEIQ